jgi:hypothetical protein
MRFATVLAQTGELPVLRCQGILALPEGLLRPAPVLARLGNPGLGLRGGLLRTKGFAQEGLHHRQFQRLMVTALL